MSNKENQVPDWDVDHSAVMRRMIVVPFTPGSSGASEVKHIIHQRAQDHNTETVTLAMGLAGLRDCTQAVPELVSSTDEDKITDLVASYMRSQQQQQ